MKQIFNKVGRMVDAFDGFDNIVAKAANNAQAKKLAINAFNRKIDRLSKQMSLPSPETATPSNLGTKGNPIVAGGPDMTTYYDMAKRSGKFVPSSQLGGYRIGDATPLGPIVDNVVHFGKPKYKIQGSEKLFTPGELGEVYRMTNTFEDFVDDIAQATPGNPQFDPEFGMKRQYLADSLAQEM